VHNDRNAGGRSDGPQRAGGVRRVDRPVRAEPALRGHPAGEDRWQRRLVELQNDRRAGQPLLHVGHVPPQALGERLGEIANRSRVAQQPATDGQVQVCGERPRTGRLDLHRTRVSAGLLGELIEVAFQQIGRAAQISAPSRRDLPAAGVQLDRQVDQEAGAAADHVGAGSAVRQFGEVRKVRQLAEHQALRLGDVGSR
jgi:hypothetical protein